MRSEIDAMGDSLAMTTERAWTEALQEEVDAMKETVASLKETVASLKETVASLQQFQQKVVGMNVPVTPEFPESQRSSSTSVRGPAASTAPQTDFRDQAPSTPQGEGMWQNGVRVPEPEDPQ